MNDDPMNEAARASVSSPPPTGGEPLQERLLWLFREALRKQRVHPLMDLVRLYREASAP
ncbi:MAG: hypothetical protein ABJD97_00565 [Betaproteobacteria bacterium]